MKELTKSQIINLLVNKYSIDREWCNNQKEDFLVELLRNLKNNF